MASEVSGAAAAGRNAVMQGAAAAAPWVRLGLSQAQRAAGMAYNQAGDIVDSAGNILAKAGADSARLVQEGSVAAMKGAAFAQQHAQAWVAAGTPYVERGLSEAQVAAGMAINEGGKLVDAGGEVLANAGADAARVAHQGAVAARMGGEYASAQAQALVRAGSPYVMRGLSEAQRAAGLAVNSAGAVVNKAGVVIAAAGADAARLAHEGAYYAMQGRDVAMQYAKFTVSAASPYVAQALSAAQVAAGVGYNKAGQMVNAAGKYVNPAGQVISQAAAEAQAQAAKAATIVAPAAQRALTEAQRAAGLAYNGAGMLVNDAGKFVNAAGKEISESAAEAQHLAAVAAPFAAQAGGVALAAAGAAVAQGREAVMQGAQAAAPWVRTGLTQAQRGAGLAYNKAGDVVNSAGQVMAKAGADAARFAQEGMAASAKGAAYAQAHARAVVAAGSPYVMRGLSEAQVAAGMAINEAGNIVAASGEILAKAGDDAAKLAHQGAVAAQIGAGEAQAQAQALVRAGSPYVMRGLSEAQVAAGLAVNAAGAVVNRAGVVIAAAGADAARLAHEGAYYAMQGREVAMQYAKFAVSAASPYAAQALSAAQVAAGVGYNKAGQLVNAAGKFVNPAGAVISQAAAEAQAQAARAATILAPAAAVALTEAQRAAGLAYNGAGMLVNDAGKLVNAAGREISEAAAQAQQAAAFAAPFAAQAGRAIAGAAMEGFADGRELAGEAAAALAPAAAAVGAAAYAGMEETKTAAVAAGTFVAGAAGDVYNSEFVRNAGAIAWDGIDDAFTMSREAIGVAMAAVSGVGAACFNFIKFDIVRDFAQTIGLFFSSITSKAMLEAKAVWGNLTNLVNVDFSFTFNSKDLLLAMYCLIAIVAIILIVAFIWFVCTADKLNPDSIRDGYESRSWKELADSNKKTVKALRYILTAIMSAYLPVSRIVFQVLACDPVILSLADKAGIAHIAAGKCWDWGGYVYVFIGALVLLASFVLFVPIFVYKKIKENIPVGSERDPNIRYDEDGVEQAYTDEMFHEDVLKDPKQVKCPYQFLYKGYERKWCYYKVLVMGIKLLLCLPVIFLKSHALAQSALTLLILLGFSGISFYASPFISPLADRMDTSGRITTFLTVTFGLIATNEVAPSTSEFMGILINILNTINALLMIAMILLGFEKVKIWIKNKTGRLEFRDTCLDVTGSFQYIFPKWIQEGRLVREAKHRIWHPFWDSVMLKLCGDDVAERLIELQDVCHNEGRQRIKKHQAAMRHPNFVRDAAKVQRELEGVDVYWNGVSRDGHNDSKTFFGKMYVRPFPFCCVMVYDDADDEADVEPDQFAKFVQLNWSPEIKARRERRQMLRCLSGQEVYLPHTRMETHSVPDGVETFTDSEGNVQTKQRTANVQVEMHYQRGRLNVKANTSKPYAAGFTATIAYSDGRGQGRAPHTGQVHEVHGSCVIGGAEMGLTAEFEMTPRLRELLHHPQNRPIWEGRIRGMLEADMQYRQRLITERVAKEALLSSDFWLNVYDAFALDRNLLTAHLVNRESNPVIKALPAERREGLDYLYHRLRYVLSHPCCLLWFVMWEDFFECNKKMAVVAKHADDFDPKKSNSIVYRPMPRQQLEGWLRERDLYDQGKFLCFSEKLITPAILDQFYAEMDRLNGTGRPAGANRV